MTILSDEVLIETLHAMDRNAGNQAAAAKELGIARSSLQARLEKATSRGLGSHFVTSPLPSGLALRGTSTLYGPDGEVKGQWIKANIELEEIISAIKGAFEEYETRPPVKKTLPNAFGPGASHTVYPIADLHFGMYAWKEETGNDYDIYIAAEKLQQTYAELLSRTPSSPVGIILNLGDFFHSDNDEQRTRRGGNKQDVDTRYARVLREGVMLFMHLVDMAKQNHETVLIKNIPGNHDPYGSLALTTALAARYSQEERVIVDTEAAPIWVYQFGRTLLSAAHGDMVKPDDVPALLAGNFAEEWGKSDWRYVYCGHTHQRRVIERGGAEVEVFRTLAPKDAWSTQMGFTARRSLISISHDANKGEVHREVVNVK